MWDMKNLYYTIENQSHLVKIALHPLRIPILVRAENRAELGVGPPCDQKIKKRVIQKSEVVSAENK